MTKEIWKFYKEISQTNQYRNKGDIFTVSSFGNVKCNNEPYDCPIVNGYYYLFRIPLHRIIAEKFLHDWNPNLMVDHKDTNRLNNRVDNLQMVDAKGNQNNPLTKKHISESKRGQSLSEEHKRKISDSLKGKIVLEETKKKISESKRGKSLSEEHKQNLHKPHKKRT